MSEPFTLGAVARHFGCHVWQVRRLFERGLLAEPRRIGQYRILTAADLPRVEDALRRAGYLKAEEVVSVS